MAFQKKWEAVPPTALIADGSQFGVVSVTDTQLIKVGQYGYLAGTALPNKRVQVKRVLSSTTFIVGPIDTNMLPSHFTNVSAYTVAANSFYQAEEQDKTLLTDADIFEAVYEREATNALRTILVDPYGKMYSPSNPLPINFSGTVNVLGATDKSAFTYGTDKEMPIGGVFNDSAASVVSGTTAAARITQFRALHSNLRDSAGNEITSTVANAKRGLDVNIIDMNLDIGTVDQGAAAAIGSAWPTKITDGTTVAGITLAGALKVDGSAVTQPVSIASAADTVVSGSLTALNSTVVINTAGLSTVGVDISGSWVGTITPEGQVNGIWYPLQFVDTGGGLLGLTWSANNLAQLNVAGLAQIRLRMSAFTSGSASIVLRGSIGVGLVSLSESLPQGGNTIGKTDQGVGGAIGSAWPIKITDGTNTALVSSSGGLIVSGLTAVGLTPSNNPISVSGVDGGGLKRHFLLDTAGRVQSSINDAAGAVVGPLVAISGTNYLPVVLASSATPGSGVPARSQMVAGKDPSGNAQSISVDTTGAQKSGGKSATQAPVRNDYTSTAVTTAAYTQLVASCAANVTEIEIFDSSGQTLALAFGAAASEVNQIFIIPGGNGRIPLFIPSGTRVSIKAISANASVGEIDINFYS